MTDTTLRQIADLPNLSYDELKQLWRILHGKDSPAYSKPYLIKRLAYRIQELTYGGLSENAKTKLKEAFEAGGFDENGGVKVDKRTLRKRSNDMPVIGTRFVREWNGERYEVIVVEGGFEYQGRRYRSLTGIAKAITGGHWNGPAFFGINRSRGKGGRS